MKNNPFIIGLSKSNKTEEMELLEKAVDKAISDRDKRLFDEEVGSQNTLFN